MFHPTSPSPRRRDIETALFPHCGALRCAEEQGDAAAEQNEMAEAFLVQSAKIDLRTKALVRALGVGDPVTDFPKICGFAGATSISD